MIVLGDARHLPFADKTAHCCVTSPPYWGLRDYGTAKWEGGSVECEHKNGPLASPKSTLEGYTSPSVKLATGGMSFKDICGKCGATRIDKQLGLERTPEEYISEMVQVFREVKRVLRDDGTLWLNMGDSYASSWPAPNTRRNIIDNPMSGGKRGPGRPERMGGDLKEKDLVGIPWMLAFALRADGWYLRSDIIWSKPNPMPESVTDRPTKAHEYIFLLSKSERYYYDAEVIKEPWTCDRDDMREKGVRTGLGYLQQGPLASNHTPRKARDNFKRNGSKREQPIPGQRMGTHRPDREDSAYDLSGRNKRSVWEVATQPFPEAHFATFPEELIKPCILAGCPAGGTVLDPFMGSGTTALVARNLQCNAIGVELNPAYIEIANRRLAQEVFAF